MPIQRKYDFQPGTKISSTQVDEEFNQLVGNDNVLEGKITALETGAAALDTRVDALEDFTINYVTPTLLNGWVANSAPNYPPRFWKDKDGIVHFRLALMSGSPGINVVIMYFPVGYRPVNAEMFEGFCDGNPTTRILYHVRYDGELKIIRTAAANSLIILNGSFKAVN